MWIRGEHTDRLMVIDIAEYIRQIPRFDLAVEGVIDVPEMLNQHVGQALLVMTGDGVDDLLVL